ncbi:hypothetical protein [Crocosphaera sp. XPORK-15E]|uniref:hypothetical protein n=1 Tax=Crocosphaera sp. XPORK-15E TaxID=3110247 RepID=UPI002B20D1A6|nr:hypothetical protein [Crocosphaera sp. XPORK-15E]MEA5533287.1 hypothetical protein [Crocosphaera sp. XPORK-15E]
MKPISTSSFLGLLAAISASAVLVLLGLLATGYFNAIVSSLDFRIKTASVAPINIEDIANPKPTKPGDRLTTIISGNKNEVEVT